MSDKSCARCKYFKADCLFPEPQDGSRWPFMIAAAMPDPREGGKDCIQFAAALERKPE